MIRKHLALLLLLLLFTGCPQEDGGGSMGTALLAEAVHRDQLSSSAIGDWVFTANDGEKYYVTIKKNGANFEWWENGQKFCDLIVQGIGSELLADFQLAYDEGGVAVEEWWMIQLWMDGNTGNWNGYISLVITHDEAIWRTGYDQIWGIRR